MATYRSFGLIIGLILSAYVLFSVPATAEIAPAAPRPDDNPGSAANSAAELPSQRQPDNQTIALRTAAESVPQQISDTRTAARTTTASSSPGPTYDNHTTVNRYIVCCTDNVIEVYDMHGDRVDYISKTAVAALDPAGQNTLMYTQAFAIGRSGSTLTVEALDSNFSTELRYASCFGE